MKRHEVMGFLLVLCGFSVGCMDDTALMADICGDGIRDRSEECDRDDFDDALLVCPDGMIALPEKSFQCNDACKVDRSDVCAVPVCGDGVISGEEACDGENFREGVRMCPGDLGEKDDAVYRCTDRCTVDLSQACEAPVCGDGKLTGNERCDGVLLAENVTCPEGWEPIENRKIACSEACEPLFDTGCVERGKREPNLYFSERRFVEDKETHKTGLVSIEIANLGSATHLHDCYIVGKRLDPYDETKLSTDPVFRIPLGIHIIGNSVENARNVFTFCAESEDLWYDAFVDRYYNYPDICQRLFDEFEMRNKQCASNCYDEYDAMSEEWGHCMVGCNSWQVQYANDSYHCKEEVKKNKQINACTVRRTEPQLMLDYAQKTASSPVDALVLQCGERIYDIMYHNEVAPGARLCQDHKKITTITPTGDVLPPPYDSNNQSTWLFEPVHRSYYTVDATYGEAICGKLSPIVN